MEKKIEEYKTFIINVLRPRLDVAKHAQQVIQDEIVEYEDLRNRLRGDDPLLCQWWGNEDAAAVENSKESIVVKADLGHGKVFCEATTTTTTLATKDRTIFVHVGMGFHVELTKDEAMDYVERRLSILDDVHKLRANKTNEIKQHVASAEQILDALHQKYALGHL